ncbi:MAG: hypothetical protein NVSMB4_16530 [Acidimicrobiales bacterium]
MAIEIEPANAVAGERLEAFFAGAPSTAQASTRWSSRRAPGRQATSATGAVNWEL